MITINPQRSDVLIYMLINIWDASVRASHHFVTNDDILNLTPIVKAGIEHIDIIIVYYIEKQPISFMGIEGDKIEMLFVSPDYFNKGIGKKLAQLAIEQYNVKYVDVNEQNTIALGFYQHLGFEIFDRKEFDNQGNHYPIINLSVQ